MVEVEAAEKVQAALLRLYGVEAQASSKDEPQIQVLEAVVLIIVEDVHEKPRTHIVVIRHASSNGSRRVCARAVDQGRGLDDVEVQGSLVGIRDACGLDAGRER